MSTILSPLYRLLKKDIKFTWTTECDRAFNEVKNSLKSADVLAHYNPDLPVRLTVDASSVGIGAVLSHKFASGTEKPIAFASRVLTASERKYSQIEREALAIIYGVITFNNYLYGTNFTLVTDHKPLLSIFGENKAIPQFSANRLRRWAVILAGYNYKIEYVKSNQNNADWLSRLPVEDEYNTWTDDVEVDYCFFLNNAEHFQLNFETVKHKTLDDPTLQKVKDYITNGWPSKVNDVEAEVKPYFSKRYEFTLNDDCIMWNHRIVIPSQLQGSILSQLHMTHLGVVKMKSLARGYFWFPNIDIEIENLSKSCEVCNLHGNNPPKTKILPWPTPTGPWQRLHIDHFEFHKQMYLLIVDAYSKWLEVFEVKSLTSDSTIQVMRSLFARFGLPITIVSDNGRSFASDEFNSFLFKNNVKHLTSPPYHPSSNGAAENAVRIIKNALKRTIVNDNVSKSNLSLCRFLFDYRNTPHCTTGISPATLMYINKPATRQLLTGLKKPKLRKLNIAEGEHMFTSWVKMF